MKLFGFTLTKTETQTETPAPTFLVPSKPAPLVSPIEVRELPEETPTFERVYLVALPEKRSMKVTIERSICGIRFGGMLYQANGAYVFFEPDHVADTILDRDLVPLIEHYCRLIIATDRAWRDSRPTQFIDKAGAVWQRLSK